MPHQHQQILVRVETKDRFPKDDRLYLVENDVAWYNESTNTWNDTEYQTIHPNYWYEPATAIVLSVEEYDSAMRAAYLNGYQAANGYKP